MNEEIKNLYDSLEHLHKATIRAVFEQSPKMLLYIDLLEQGEVIVTNKAVNYIYNEELDSVDRNVLINRFYKLRNKLRLWLLTQMKNSPLCLTEEEQELAFLRLMIIKNEHIYALKQLQTLEQKCWEHNIFELLPEVIQLILRALHACKNLEKKEYKKYLDKLEEANHLMAVLDTLKYNFLYLFHDVKVTSSTIESIARKIKKLKHYPRFEMFYHYISFLGGVYSELPVKTTSNALSRHLNQLNQLKEQYPLIPILEYEPYHREKAEIYFCNTESVFWYYKKDTKRCYQAIARRKKIIKNNPDLYFKLSESELHNIIYFCLNAEEYREALEYIDELKEYQLNNPHDNIESPYYAYTLVTYIGLFPKHKITNTEELINQINQFLQTATAQSAWIYGSLAEFCILYGYYEEAQKALNNPIFIKYFDGYGIPIQTDKLLELILSKNKSGLKQFIGELTDLYKSADSSKVKFHYKGVLKIAQYVEKT